MIAGYVKSSFVDYPGRIACTVFFAGCNYDCFFCHNRGLLGDCAQRVDEQEVFAHLARRRNLLDGVVLTGGEPTLQRGIADFARRARALGYAVKLDTNGSRPAEVDSLLAEGLVDYVALDLKAPAERYGELCGGAADFAAVLRTLDRIRVRGVEYECRTTFLPQLGVEDIARMLAQAAPVARWALQGYNVPPQYRPEDEARICAQPHSREEFKAALAAAAPYARAVVDRG